MKIEEQVKIMEKQLSNFDCLADKMLYMHMVFDKDPEYTKKARDTVRGNISMGLSNA